MKNILFTIIAVVAVSLGALFLFGDSSFEQKKPVVETDLGNTVTSTSEVENNRSVVTPGTYQVDSERSVFSWAGKKPLIDGYVNSGTIGVTGGNVIVEEAAAGGSFTLDMDTLQVGLTAQKPGQEGRLEEHLKGERWFDVAAYPTAEFVITNVATTTDSDTTFWYTVTGDLTIKGKTNEISFPTRIYQTEDGLLYAEAETEIDRTLWEVTSGSGNFFENLGDNLIADKMAISFSIVAKPQ